MDRRQAAASAASARSARSARSQGAAARGPLGALIAAAARARLPAAAAERARWAPRRARAAARGPDLEARGARDAWARLARGAEGEGAGGAARARVETRTALGAARVREFASARALAEDVLDGVDAEGLKALCVDARSDEAGVLLFTSREHAERQRRKGLLQCRVCARFARGERGLRDHQLVAHGRTYGESVQAAAAAATALTVYERRGPLGWAGGVGDHQDRQDRQDQEARAARKPQQPREATPAEVLCEAAKNGDVHAVEQALEDLKTRDGPETRERVKAEAAALGWAAGSGNVEILRLLVASGQHVNANPGMPDPADKLGRTALHWAARKGQLESVQVLVEECGVDMNACMKEGTSVFHYAVYGDAQNVCEYLRARGADVHHINKHGCNAAQWAALTGSCAMFRYLASSCDLDLNVRSKNGHTVLHKTAQRGHLDACRWLVHQLPHLVAARDKEGSTAADLAVLNAHRPVADFLRNPNAETVSKNEIPET